MPKRKKPNLIRVHDTGTRAVIRHHAEGWRINLDIKEANQQPVTIVGYLSPTEEKAKELAGIEVRRYGHRCNAACKNWERP